MICPRCRAAEMAATPISTRHDAVKLVIVVILLVGAVLCYVAGHTGYALVPLGIVGLVFARRRVRLRCPACGYAMTRNRSRYERAERDARYARLKSQTHGAARAALDLERMGEWSEAGLDPDQQARQSPEFYREMGHLIPFMLIVMGIFAVIVCAQASIMGYDAYISKPYYLIELVVMTIIIMIPFCRAGMREHDRRNKKNK